MTMSMSMSTLSMVRCTSRYRCRPRSRFVRFRYTSPTNPCALAAIPSSSWTSSWTSSLLYQSTRQASGTSSSSSTSNAANSHPRDLPKGQKLERTSSFVSVSKPLSKSNRFQRTAEDAVNNILYDAPSRHDTVKHRHMLSVLVDNEAGVLSKVSGLLAARGFNIDSLTVSSTDVPDLSRMTIVLDTPDAQLEQARRQLEDLVDVWAVVDLSKHATLERELLVLKVDLLPPAQREAVVSGRAAAAEAAAATAAQGEVDQVMTMGRAREKGKGQSKSQSHSQTSTSTPSNKQTPSHEEEYDPTSPSSTNSLHQNQNQNPSEDRDPSHTSTYEEDMARHFHRSAIFDIVKMFQGHIADIGTEHMIVETVAPPRRIDALIHMLRPYGVIEATRSGVIAMQRARVASLHDVEVMDEDDLDEEEMILPPS